MNKIALKKGLKRITIFILFCFIGPVILMEAFKNKEHPFYIPVLIVGLLSISAAIGYGFWGINTIISAFFGKKNKYK